MPNHLQSTKSLYLQKHVDNPINWWYWCESALAEAKRDNKPIFLSIGYSSCHWCTVMEGEAFSDQAIADYLNSNFLPIKVDREERPDIDSIYMQGLQMMTGQGGWPLNIFLNPEDLVPFYGGTYFPVEPKYGRPGFLEMLKSIRRFYDHEPEKLLAFKREILSNLQQSATLPVNQEISLDRDLLNQGINANTAAIQPNDFGRPSFPMIPYAAIALQSSRLEQEYDYNPQALSQQRGLDLVTGGIYDHVAGGFHRYTVDNTWTVPHFEKMLYDNGQIIEYLANLWSSGVQQPAIQRAIQRGLGGFHPTKRCKPHERYPKVYPLGLYQEAIALTVQWLKREMTHPQGYFYAAQDADNFTTPEAVEPEEGDFYVWSYQELESLLSAPELAELEQEFTVTPGGNFEGKNVLQRLSDSKLADSLEQTLGKLFNLRYGQSITEIEIFPPAKNNQEAKTNNWLGRIPPVTDTKAIAAWNSLMISGLARAYSVFREQAYLDLATRAMEFILQNQWLEGRFQRLNYDGVATVPAQSEDYALLIKALLDLQAACPEDSQWLEHALKIQEEFDDLLWSIEQGGYYNNSTDAGKELLVRERSYLDNATPSANGIAIANLIRLSLLTDNLEYREQAHRGLQAFSLVMLKSPTACPSLFTALDWWLHGTSVKTTREQIEQLSSHYLPTTVYRIEAEFPENSIALVCTSSSCLEPATTMEQILEQIDGATNSMLNIVD